MISLTNSLLRQHSLTDSAVGTGRPVGQYTLSAAMSVSTGIYYYDGDGNEVLVRTLESYVQKEAGTNYIYWDGNDDFGNDISTDHTYHAGILRIPNTVEATWNDTIGNTSTYQTGANKIVNNKPIIGFAQWTDGGVDHWISISGYSEGRTCIYRGIQSNINEGTLLTIVSGTPLTAEYICISDNKKWAFICGRDPYSPTLASMVYGIDLATNQILTLSSGSTYKPVEGEEYSSVIAKVTTDATDQISGLACINGYLYVCRGHDNKIYIYDVTNNTTPTGAYVSTDTTYTNPRKIVADTSNGGRVWFINSTNQIVQCLSDTGGALTGLALTISDFPSNKISLAIDNSGAARLYILVGGANQQVYNWNVSALYPGTSHGTTRGQLGGYRANGALVEDDKFYFTDSNAAGNAIFRTMDDPAISIGNGTFAVIEPGLYWVRQYNTSWTRLDTLQTIPLSYYTSLNRKNADSVFIEGLEFRNNAGVWSLYAQWLAAIGIEFFATGKVYATYTTLGEYFDSVSNYSNGETYAVLNYYQNATNYTTASNWNPYPEIIRIDYDNMALVFGGHSFGLSSRFGVDKDGNIFTIKGTQSVGSTSCYIEYQELTGFDGSLWPTYASPVHYCDFADPITDLDTIFETFARPSVLPDGTFVYFSEEKNKGATYLEGYHLGWMRQGATAPFAQGAIGSRQNYYGEHPSEFGHFEIGNGITYAGGMMATAGEWIFFNEHDEFWKGGQTNIFSCFHKKGLKIFHFGDTTWDGRVLYGFYAPIKSAGNTQRIEAIALDSDSAFVVGNDESIHSGTQNWTVAGLSGVTFNMIPIVTPPNYAPIDGTELMDDVPVDDTIASTTITSRIELSSAPYEIDGDNYLRVVTNKRRLNYDHSISFNYRGRTDGTSTDETMDITLNPGLNWGKAVITGLMDWEGDVGLNGGTPSEGTVYFNILDSTGKKLVECYTKRLSPGTPYQKALMVNGIKLIEKLNGAAVNNSAYTEFDYMANKGQNIRVEISALGILFIYYDYDRHSRTTTVYNSTTVHGSMLDVAEVGADWTLIDKIQILGKVSTVAASDDHAITITNLIENYEAAVPTVPTVLSMETIDTTHIRVTFDQPTTPTTAGWSFEADASPLTLTSVAGSGSVWDYLVSTMAEGDALTGSYDSTTGNTVADYGGLELASFTDSSVTNNIVAFTTLTYGTNNVAGGSTTITSPSFNCQAGSTVLVWWKSRVYAGVSSIADTAGNTYVLDKTVTMVDGDGIMRLYRCTNATANATNVITITGSAASTDQTIFVRQVSGLSLTPLDATDYSAPANHAPPIVMTTAGITTSQANIYAFAFYSKGYASPASFTAPSGYTVLGMDGLTLGEVAEKVYSSIQTSLQITAESNTGDQPCALGVGYYKIG